MPSEQKIKRLAEDVARGVYSYDAEFFEKDLRTMLAANSVPATPDWWCCKADYPNHEASCKNAATPADDLTPTTNTGDENVENWRQPLFTTPADKESQPVASIPADKCVECGCDFVKASGEVFTVNLDCDHECHHDQG